MEVEEEKLAKCKTIQDLKNLAWELALKETSKETSKEKKQKTETENPRDIKKEVRIALAELKQEGENNAYDKHL